MANSPLVCPKCYGIIESFNEGVTRGVCPHCKTLVNDVNRLQKEFELNYRDQTKTVNSDLNEYEMLFTNENNNSSKPSDEKGTFRSAEPNLTDRNSHSNTEKSDNPKLSTSRGMNYKLFGYSGAAAMAIASMLPMLSFLMFDLNLDKMLSGAGIIVMAFSILAIVLIYFEQQSYMMVSATVAMIITFFAVTTKYNSTDLNIRVEYGFGLMIIGYILVLFSFFTTNNKGRNFVTNVTEKVQNTDYRNEYTKISQSLSSKVKKNKVKITRKTIYVMLTSIVVFVLLIGGYFVATYYFNKPKVESVMLDMDSAYLEVGDTLELTASIWPIDLSDEILTWSTSDPGIATVNNGIVSGINEGTTDIVVRSSNGKTSTCIITVIKPSISSENLVKSVTDVDFSDFDGYSFVFGLKDANGNYVKTSGKVDLIIINTDGEQVYYKKLLFKNSNFFVSTGADGVSEKLLSSVYLDENDFDFTSINTGYIYYTIILENDTLFFEDTIYTDLLP
jgi:hypothetical protein